MHRRRGLKSSRPESVRKQSWALSPRRPSAPQKLALITLSGETVLASGNDVWCGIASVMARVGANIEDAAGAFMRIDEQAKLRRDLCKEFQTFSAHPFGTRLTRVSVSSEDGRERFAVAVLVKATIAENVVEEMSHRLHTTFPRLVCTVSYGGVPADVALSEGSPAARPEKQGAIGGTIRLFGEDKAGQLASIADVLARSHVTILNLMVSTGYGDRDTYEFLEHPGGPLGENVIQVAAFGEADFDEEAFTQEIARVVTDAGYTVMSVLFDKQTSRSTRGQGLADYYLKRKSYIKTFLEKEDASLHC